MNIHKIKFGAGIAIAFFPFIASAKTLRDIVDLAISYFQVGINLIIGLAFLTFVWNVYRYFFTEKDKKEAGLYVLYSTIGFFVILSIWGLVALLTGTLKLDTAIPTTWPFTTSPLNSAPNPGNSFPSKTN